MDGTSNPTDVSLRQYAELLVKELGKRVDEKFTAAKESVVTALNSSEKALSAALAAQDKLTSQAFTAAKEALKEAQIQLAEYKSASNEWRSTLTDLIAKGMLRPEVETRFASMADRFSLLETRISALQSRLDSNIGLYVLRSFYDEQHINLRDSMDGRMKVLENAKSNLDGRMAVISGGVGIVVLLISHFWK